MLWHRNCRPSFVTSCRAFSSFFRLNYLWISTLMAKEPLWLAHCETNLCCGSYWSTNNRGCFGNSSCPENRTYPWACHNNFLVIPGWWSFELFASYCQDDWRFVRSVPGVSAPHVGHIYSISPPWALRVAGAAPGPRLLVGVSFCWGGTHCTSVCNLCFPKCHLYKLWDRSVARWSLPFIQPVFHPRVRLLPISSDCFQIGAWSAWHCCRRTRKISIWSS